MRPTRDEHGDPIAAPAPHTIAEVAITPAETETDHDGRETAVVELNLYCPTGADIQIGDRVQLPGDTTTYVVDGKPKVWGPCPWTGWDPGIDVHVRGVK
ncbi:hypothetical protein [Nocardia aurea]|uniref:hypothetical protein n=1 Tax=Nocardia aurea TaxID=2144174 RepID=UPI0033B8A6A7